MPYASVTRFRRMEERHLFRPLRVMSKNGVALPVQQWASVVPGSLVLVTFSLHHRPRKGMDGFVAWPRKLVVVKEGTPKRVVKKARVAKEVKKEAIVGPLDKWLLKRQKSREDE